MAEVNAILDKSLPDTLYTHDLRVMSLRSYDAIRLHGRDVLFDKRRIIYIIIVVIIMYCCYYVHAGRDATRYGEMKCCGATGIIFV